MAISNRAKNMPYENNLLIFLGIMIITVNHMKKICIVYLLSTIYFLSSMSSDLKIIKFLVSSKLNNTLFIGFQINIGNIFEIRQ